MTPLPQAQRKASRIAWAILAFWCGILPSQAQLQSVGGGRITADGSDAGFVDGNTFLVSQFNQPSGLVQRSPNVLIVADAGNNAVRRVEVAGETSTLITGLNRPVDVAVDAADNLYVLTAGSGQILRYDRYDSLYQFPALVNTVPLSNPTAFTLDEGTNIYVVEFGGALKRVPMTNGAPFTVTNGLSQPGGITTLASGLLAVAESGRNVIRLIDPVSGVTVQTIGVPKASITDGIYFRDGPGNQARFNGPTGIDRAPNSSLVVADRLNHRVRVISVDGVVSTLYGVDPSLWAPQCLQCNPIILPGWWNGTSDPLTAESRLPSSVTVTADGLAYVTEQYYHIIRSVLSHALVATPGSGGGGSSNLLVLPPLVTPDSGYHPMGVLISVTNPNTNAFFLNSVHFTTDGTDPTTNSPSVAMTNGVGTLLWRDAARSLASLRVRAFVGSIGSQVVSGRRGAVTEVGLSRHVLAGMGSTVLLPIVLNIQEGSTNVVRSLQFRVEFKPTNGAPIIPPHLTAVPIGTNDFVTVSGAAADRPALGGYSQYTFLGTRGVSVSFIGTNANFLVRSHAVVSLLSVPIPATATPGQGYWVSILEPSATSDGAEAAIPIFAMPPKLVSVTNVSYIVGDSSPGVWYNAENSGATAETSLGFGNGNLRNSDVNNAFAVALGARAVPSSSDLFDAMDAYPEDNASKAGGDGQVRFLDWQVILRRSLFPSDPNWRRTWSAGGVRTVTSATLNTNALDNPVASFDASLKASRWDPPAQIQAGIQDWMEAGSTALIPITVNLYDGNRLAGMQVRVTVQPEGSTPPLIHPVRFVANTNRVPEPLEVSGVGGNEVGVAWSLLQSSFQPPLTGQTLLGTLQVTVPDSVRPGDSYRITFSHASGAPDMNTEFDFDLASGGLWIGSARPASDPPKALRGLRLTWFGVQAVRYNVEASTDLRIWNPIQTDLVGTGRTLEYIDTQATSSTRFYRVVETP